MKPIASIISLAGSISVSLFLGVGFSASSACADQVTLQNGDVLNGKVLAMTTNSLVLQDDSLGTLTLSRLKVSNITFGAVRVSAGDVRPLGAPGLQANANSALDSDLRALSQEIRDHSNLVQQVEAQILGSSASPAADSKFNEILGELSSGQMNMNGLRSEAQSAADQLRDYKKEMGSDAGEEVDAYLSVLNTFLRETAPTNGAP
jgi:hypothetical protein